MDSKPEGFLWFRSGAYDERKVDRDVRDHLPAWYGQHGLIDMQVVKDTLIADESTGKAILRLSVEEGQVYQVGTISIVGNRRFSTEELGALIPFAPPDQIGSGKTIGGAVRSYRVGERHHQGRASSTQNNGYISGNVITPSSRGARWPDGTPVLDLRWRIVEGQPATINKINIAGNEVTHERIIREAIVLLPGELFNRERLIRSYQNIANLGFFQQPMPTPDVAPAANGIDVDITFRVEEKHTGNINFGASVGQGTGLGGFLGLEEPNLFGRGKHGKLQWQFGQNITDFQLSYTDPDAVRQPASPAPRRCTTRSLRVHRRRSRPAAIRRRVAAGRACRSWIALLARLRQLRLAARHATPTARPTCSRRSSARRAPARRWASRSCATPGSACRFPSPATWSP